MIYQRMLSDFKELIASLHEDRIGCHFAMGGCFPTLEYNRALEMYFAARFHHQT
ncbi:MAG: hypothetical protein IPI63_02405 [Methanothrix sp.]|jgi:hypothetical protein|nr:hypothetical protein [Methanothrix sp.]MBK7385627.1 hypothetical protein [Methanothrix sp.]HPW73253.1 hypothetical protein [Methanothrix sp.]